VTELTHSVAERGRSAAEQAKRSAEELRQRRALPAQPRPPRTSVRLFVGPANFAGQGTTWARAAERHLVGVGARNMSVSGGAYRFPVDMEVPRDLLENPYWQDRQIHYLTSRFSHVLIEAGRPVLGARYGKNCAGEIKVLRDAGVSIALAAHGSDVRLPSRHAETHEWSPFHEHDQFYVRLEAQARREGQLFNTFEGHTFVSTPDLLVDVPGAKWLPVVIEPDRWHADRAPLERPRPVVVHAPTNPRFKGTSYVDAAMRPLHQSGLIEYRKVTDVPSEQMPAVIGDADIVLEQFVLGPYSVTSCEAMAAGRVVVAAVDRGVREHVKEATGRDLPIVHADPKTLARVVEELVADSDSAQELAARGPAYVRAVHDGTMSAAVLGTWLTPPTERQR
jgi:hypothetical protein